MECNEKKLETDGANLNSLACVSPQFIFLDQKGELVKSLRVWMIFLICIFLSLSGFAYAEDVPQKMEKPLIERELIDSDAQKDVGGMLPANSAQREAASLKAGEISWVLPRLNEIERRSRIDFFLSRKPFHNLYRASTENASVCADQYKQLLNGEYVVLTPVAFSSRDRQVQDKALRHCGGAFQTELSTIRLTRGDDEPYRLYSIPRENEEYYDFSDQIGGDLWGVFAEGGHLECQSLGGASCPDGLDYVSPGFTVGSVFDSRTCATLLPPEYFISSRLLPHSVVGNSSEEKRGYLEAPSVYAFIKIETSIVRLSLEVKDYWQRFSGVLSDEGASLQLTSVSNGKRCVYATREYIIEQ